MPDAATAEAAIFAALSRNWTLAVRINNVILQENKTDIASLNRLGYAYAQMGRRALAKSTFERVLSLDPYNQIALKHLKNAGASKKYVAAETIPPYVSPLSFLEEPGVTKIVSCVNLAPAQTLGGLSPGMELMLKARNHCVEVRVPPNTYVAALPDDLSFKLIKLIASGNRYRTIVKGVAKKSLTLMLREIERGKKFASQPSFTASNVTLSPSTHAPLDRDEDKQNAAGAGETDESEEAVNEE